MGANSSTSDHPLQDAVKGHWEDYFLKLSQGKGSVDDAPKDGWTALHHAAKQGMPNTICKLIAMGADVERRTGYGKTPLSVAVHYKQVEAVRSFLENGGDVNLQDADGDTALHYAAQSGSVNTIVMLIELGADVDLQNNFGWTALHKAALLKGKKMFDAGKRLVELGADVTIKTQTGSTAADVARAQGGPELAAFLEAAEICHPVAESVPDRRSSSARRSRTRSTISPSPSVMPTLSEENLGRLYLAKSNSAFMAPALKPLAPPPYRRSNSAHDIYKTQPSKDTIDIFHSSRDSRKADLPLAALPMSPRTRISLTKERRKKDYVPEVGHTSAKLKLLTEQLAPLFEALGLMDKLPLAAAWCVEQGADHVDDIRDDEGCVEDLADAIGLPRIKRNKLIARLAHSEFVSIKVRSI